MNKGKENSLFQKNLEIFAKRYPDCVNKFLNKEYKKSEKDVVIGVEQSYAGGPILTIEKDKQKKYLAGKYAPERPLLDWIEKQERIYHESVLFIIGMGNWIQLETFLHHIDKKITVILYEPCVEIFEKVMENYDVADMLERYEVGLVIEQINPEYLNTFFEACIHRENISLTKIFVSGNYLFLFPSLVKSKVEELKKYFEKTIISWNTKIRYTNVTGENVLNNITYFYHGYSVAQFKNVLPSNVPVVIVSAGPSLNNNIDDLKAAVGKCCIIATDTAIKPLLNRKIQPDFVAIVDGKKPAKLFEHQDISKSAFVTSTVVAKDVMNLHQGRKVFCSTGNAYDNGVLEAINEAKVDGKLEIPILPTGGSVANTAFSFALYMGAKTIILMGQDLAMTGNKTHADGTFKDKMECIDVASKEYFEVESIDGDKILTRDDFDFYRKWFESSIRDLNSKNTGVKVIDATEGGAKIHGTIIKLLKEAIEENCISEFCMSEKISEMSGMMSDEDKKVLIEYFADTVTKLEEVKENAELGIKYYDKMIELSMARKINTSKYLELLKKIKKINDFMDSNKMARFVLSNLEEMENAMLSTIYLSKEDECDEHVVLAKKGKVILETMLPMIDTLEGIAKDTVMQYHGDDTILYTKYHSAE